ncbi:GNAT family N-acetyltransferase [Rothia uropygialis]|uniref:GNAT family N-acetyltransferase n=1 Tax=Kocuria sp. 36 TaxID=1415402 RepID=UPI00101D3E8F|nr:GNAT family N-acetyltransferase [Kocuria sp. 36]
MSRNNTVDESAAAPQNPEGRPTVRRGHWLDLDPRTTYELARLRYQVFTMGQGITSEQDLDGKDLEPGTTTYWIEVDGLPVSTLRVLVQPSGNPAIGRVATSPSHRGEGLAGTLMEAAVSDNAHKLIDLHAQAYLEKWYEGFGFVRAAHPDTEAGIPHIPMHRPTT